jgi:hypothetical protein
MDEQQQEVAVEAVEADEADLVELSVDALGFVGGGSISVILA